MHTPTHPHAHPHMHTHTHTCTLTHAHSHMHTHVCPHMHTLTPPHAHSHMHTHICPHMHTLAPPQHTHNKSIDLPLGHRGQQSPFGVKGAPFLHLRTGQRVRCRGRGHNSLMAQLVHSPQAALLRTYIALTPGAALPLRGDPLLVGLTHRISAAHDLQETRTPSQQGAFRCHCTCVGTASTV